MPKRICLWSSPRNVSTALMYAFAQRSDSAVFDEPLYPHFLVETNSVRPDREATLASMENDGGKVVENLILGQHQSEVLFFKNIANHIVGLDLAFLEETINVILIRDPREMLLSYTKVIEQPSLLDVAMGYQEKLFKKLHAIGQQAIVIDAKQLLTNPTVVLTELCNRCGIPWMPEMLSWEAGPRKEDGPWAKYWYHGVHQSTGFKTYEAKEGDLAPNLIPLYEKCLAIYEYISPHSIQANKQIE